MAIPKVIRLQVVLSWLAAWLVGFSTPALLAQTPDIIFTEGFEGAPGANGLHGFEQFNNLTFSFQNAWARGSQTGVNDGSGTQWRPAPLDLCNVVRTITPNTANHTGLNGAHIIPAAQQFNCMPHPTVNAYQTGGPYIGHTAETFVGLYNATPISTLGYNQITVRFWLKCNGQFDPLLNQFVDYGLFRYSVNPGQPTPPFPVGAPGPNPADDSFWTTLTPNISLNPLGSGPEIQGHTNWVQAEYTLPADAANNPNLRIAFFWVNNSDDIGGFPALTIDDIQVEGYRFSAGALPLSRACKGSILRLPIEIEPGLITTPTTFTAQLSDQQGSFANPTLLASIPYTPGTRFDTITFVVPTAPPSGGGYRVRVVAGTGNESSISPTVLTLETGQTFAFTSPTTDQTICRGTDILLNTTPGATAYRWYRNGTLVDDGDRASFLAADTGTYWVEVFVGGCRYLTDSLQVAFHPLTPTPAFPLDDTVCWALRPEPFVVTGGAPAGGTYAGQGISFNTNAAQWEFNSFIAGTGRHVIKYFFNYSSGCPDSIVGYITVIEPQFARVAITAGDTDLCVGQTATVGLNTTVDNVVWFPSLETTPTITVSSAGEVFAVVTSDQGCDWQTDTLTFTLRTPDTAQAPVIGFVTLSSTPGGTTSITGTSPDAPGTQIVVFANSQPIGQTTVGVDGTWRIETLNAFAEGDTLLAFGRTDVNCDGVIDQSDAFGLPSAPYFIGSVLVTAFSPNGDGINDTWVITANPVAYTNAELNVYNRWGAEVFNKPAGNTTYWTGDNLPDGVYYFVYNPKDGTSVVKGTVTIMR